ncbi:hypothetical protein NKH72_21640 [Mesorhizobium sp. M0955]|uniref:hypothetical protein n=1 Tax=Mesorhizobium sp. M0955 TaxID=2957033 RepID=UPI00333B6592
MRSKDGYELPIRVKFRDEATLEEWEQHVAVVPQPGDWLNLEAAPDRGHAYTVKRVVHGVGEGYHFIKIWVGR